MTDTSSTVDVAPQVMQRPATATSSGRDSDLTTPLTQPAQKEAELQVLEEGEIEESTSSADLDPSLKSASPGTSASRTINANRIAYDAATRCGYNDTIDIHDAPRPLVNMSMLKAAMLGTLALVGGTTMLNYEEGDEEKEVRWDNIEHTEPRVAKMEHSLSATIKSHSDKRMGTLLHPSLSYDRDANRAMVEEGKPMWSAVTHPAHGDGLDTQDYSVGSTALGLNSSKSRKLWPMKVFPACFMAVVGGTSGGKGPANIPQAIRACCVPLYGDDEDPPEYQDTLPALKVEGPGQLAARGEYINISHIVIVDLRAGMRAAGGRMVQESKVRLVRASEALHREVIASYEEKQNIKKRNDGRTLRNAEMNEKYAQPTWLDNYFERHTRVLKNAKADKWVPPPNPPGRRARLENQRDDTRDEPPRAPGHHSFNYNGYIKPRGVDNPPSHPPHPTFRPTPNSNIDFARAFSHGPAQPASRRDNRVPPRSIGGQMGGLGLQSTQGLGSVSHQGSYSTRQASTSVEGSYRGVASNKRKREDDGDSWQQDRGGRKRHW